MAFPKGDLANLLFLLLAFGLLYLAYRLAGRLWTRRTGKTLNELITRDNQVAFSLRLMGLCLGLSLGLAGALSSPPRGLWTDLVSLAVSGLVMLALLLAAWFINDKLLVRSVDNTRELIRGNLAVGMVELGSLVATGLILKGAFTGSGTILSGAVFFVLGQTCLVIFFLVMEWLTPYSDQQELARGNLALGLHQAGMLAALGLVVSAAVTGDFTHWAQDLAEFAQAVGKGMVLLLVFSWLTDRLFLRRTTMAQEIARDQNLAAVLACLGVKLSLAVLIVHAII